MIGPRLAESLDVSTPTVAARLKPVCRDGWVEINDDKEVFLTSLRSGDDNQPDQKAYVEEGLSFNETTMIKIDDKDVILGLRLADQAIAAEEPNQLRDQSKVSFFKS